MGKPTGIRLLKSDFKLFEGLYKYDGTLSQELAKGLYYPKRTLRSWYYRQKQLVDHQYISRPTRAEIHRHPVPEPVIWLGVRGIQYIASLQNITVPENLWPLALNSSNGKKNLRLELRRAGVRWSEYPDWLRLPHHLAVCELRMLIEVAVKKSGLIFQRQITEGQFKSLFKENVVSVRYTKRGRLVEYRRSVIPDYFFIVERPGDKEYAYIVEVDRATEENPRFVHEKVRPGVVWLGSKTYQETTGVKYGRWLVVTTGKQRALNMKQAAESATRHRYFYYGAAPTLTAENFFTEPVWYATNHKDERGEPLDTPIPLLPPLRRN